jgi:hypothetical protein
MSPGCSLSAWGDGDFERTAEESTDHGEDELRTDEHDNGHKQLGCDANELPVWPGDISQGTQH